MSKVYIYGLYDPFTKELRYIGKTNDLDKRLWTHINKAELGQKTYKDDWIRSLLKRDERPIIDIIQETTEDAWQDDEKSCIAEARKMGIRLTNLTEGGDGLVGYSVSEETKKRLSEYNKSIGRVPPSWKGRKQSPEHIRKRVEARKKRGNYGHSDETKEKISQNRKGKNLGNQHTLGHKHTKKTRAKMRASHARRKNRLAKSRGD